MQPRNRRSAEREREGKRRLSRGIFLILGAVGVALAGLPACSLNTDLRRPEHARVELTGPATGSMEVVTSTNFFIVAQQISFVTADTTVTAPPLSRTYDLEVPARFYFSATNVGGGADTFTLKIWIGEESWYNETKQLAPGERFEFVYRYNEPGIS